MSQGLVAERKIPFRLPLIDINIPIFFALYAFWKIFKRTKVWRPDEMDFVRGIPTIEETESEYVVPVTFWEKVADFLF